MQKRLIKIIGIIIVVCIFSVGCGNKDKHKDNHAGKENVDLSATDTDMNDTTSSMSGEVVDANTDTLKDFSGRYVADVIIVDGTDYTPEEYFEIDEITLSINLYSDGSFSQIVDIGTELQEYKGSYKQRDDGVYIVLYDEEDPVAAEEDAYSEYFVITDDNNIKYYIEGAEINYSRYEDSASNDTNIDDKAILGEYSLIGMILDTSFYSLEELLELGVPVNGTMTVREDGSFSLTLGRETEGKPHDGTWTSLGANLYSFDDSGMALIVTFDGEKLELETGENTSYVFDKTE